MQSIGEIVKQLRESRKVSIESLAAGLCSKTALSKFEKNEITLEMAVIDNMIRRLGKSPDKLEVIISQYDYDKMLNYDLIIDALRQSDYDKALKHIEIYKKEYDVSDLDKTYIKRCYGILAYQRDEDYKKAEEIFDEVIDSMSPGLNMGAIKPYSLATTEIENIVIRCYLWIKQGKHEEADSWLGRMREYIDIYITDEEELVKLVPKIAYLQALCADEESDYDAQKKICEEAMEILIDQCSSSYVVPIMELLIPIYEYYGDNAKKEYYVLHKNNLEEIYRTFGMSIEEINHLYYSPSLRQYILDCEVIKDMRLANEKSQSAFIEGIYSDESAITRLETGKTRIKNNKLQQILKSVGIDKGRYNCYLVTKDFRALEQLVLVEKLIGKNMYVEAEKEIKKLERMIDTGVEQNRFIIELHSRTVDFRLGRNDLMNEMKAVEDELLKANIIKDKKIIRMPFPSEAKLINQLAVIYNRLEEKKKAATLLQLTLDKFTGSKVHERYSYRSSGMITGNLCKYYEELNCLEKADSIGRNKIIQALELMRMQGIHSVLTHYAAVKEKSDKKGLDYYLMSYNLNVFYRFEKSKKILEQYIKKHYNIELD